MQEKWFNEEKYLEEDQRSKRQETTTGMMESQVCSSAHDDHSLVCATNSHEAPAAYFVWHEQPTFLLLLGHAKNYKWVRALQQAPPISREFFPHFTCPFFEALVASTPRPSDLCILMEGLVRDDHVG